jgi:hypothetical protein
MTFDEIVSDYICGYRDRARAEIARPRFASGRAASAILISGVFLGLF